MYWFKLKLWVTAIGVFCYVWLLKLSSMEAIDDFISAPSEELLCQLTKEQLLSLASHYDIEIASGDKRLKDNLREALKASLAEGGVLKPSALPAYQHQLDLPQMSDAVLEFRLKELAFKERQMHLEHERFLKELEFKHAALSSSSSASAQFNVASNIRLVPPFAEKNVERYFAHFERVATVSDWPIHAWTSLLQSVLVGKAQDAYTALNMEDIKDYEKVKGAILRTYELVPEAYRQRFRGLSKLDEQTYVEFAREKEISFSSWCKSQKAETKEDLRQLVLLEDFKDCLPTAVCTYLNQQEVTTLDKAAVLADKFVLTLKVNFDNDQGERKGRTGFNRPRLPNTSST